VPGGRGGSNLRPQIPHLLRIKRLNAGINPPLPLPGGDSCSEILTVVPYLELRLDELTDVVLDLASLTELEAWLQAHPVAGDGATDESGEAS